MSNVHGNEGHSRDWGEKVKAEIDHSRDCSYKNKKYKNKKYT